MKEQFGVDNGIIDHMKDNIKTKSFTICKLKENTIDSNIGFYLEEVVVYPNGLHHQKGTQEGIVVLYS